MPYALGVDVGTAVTTTVIARAPRPGHAAVADPPRHEPSVVAVDADGAIVFASAAVEMLVTDPERTLPGWLDRVGDPVPTAVAGRAVPPDEVFALAIRRQVDAATRNEGAAPHAVVVGVPAGWRGGRIAAVRSGLDLAGLDPVLVRPAPEAVADEYLGRRGASSTILVVDAGAGSVGVSLYRSVLHAPPALLAHRSVPGLSGDALDDLMLKHVVSAAADRLGGFHASGSAARAALHGLRTGCRAARERLSALHDVVVRIDLPGAGGGEVEVSRTGFDTVSAPLVSAITRTIHQTVERAGITVDAVDTVLLVGGLARMPLLTSTLAESGRPVRVLDDPASALARAAAMSGATTLTGDPPVTAGSPVPAAPRGSRTTAVIRRATGAVAAAFSGSASIETSDGVRTSRAPLDASRTSKS